MPEPLREFPKGVRVERAEPPPPPAAPGLTLPKAADEVLKAWDAWCGAWDPDLAYGALETALVRMRQVRRRTKPDA